MAATRNAKSLRKTAQNIPSADAGQMKVTSARNFSKRTKQEWRMKCAPFFGYARMD